MLELRKLTKKAGKFVLGEINLNISRGEYHMILGNSGAGKTMLLELICGLRKPTSGAIYFEGENITGVSPRHRGFGLVYQENLLFPHMTVEKYLCYSARMRSLSIHERNTRLHEIAEQLNIQQLLKHYPEHLSGGEKQRVSIAGILSMNPSLLMLDEPLSSLDVQLRNETIEMLLRLKHSGITLLHITHDFSEAATLASHMTVLDNGSVVQTGSIHSLTSAPANAFAARFAGHPNVFDAVSSENEVRINDQIRLLAATGTSGSNGFVMIDPEKITLSDIQPADTDTRTNILEGTVLFAPPVRMPGAWIVADCGIRLRISPAGHSGVNHQLQYGDTIFCSFPAAAVRFIALKKSG